MVAFGHQIVAHHFHPFPDLSSDWPSCSWVCQVAPSVLELLSARSSVGGKAGKNIGDFFHGMMDLGQDLHSKVSF